MNPIEIEVRFLRRASELFVPDGRFAVADLVLSSFIHEIEMNARAVDLLAKSPFPDRCAPNARAAFEAAQNALLLVSSDDYAYAGALAWVYFLRKDDGTIENFESVYGQLTPEEKQAPDGGQWTFDKALNEIEDTSKQFGPGNAGLLLRAQTEIIGRRNGPDNWSGLNVAKALATQVPPFAPKELAERLANADRWRVGYSYLCRDTHTRTRLRPKWVRGKVNGPIAFEFEPVDAAATADTLVKMTAASIQFGVAALQIRHSRFATT